MTRSAQDSQVAGAMRKARAAPSAMSQPATIRVGMPSGASLGEPVCGPIAGHAAPDGERDRIPAPR